MELENDLEEMPESDWLVDPGSKGPIPMDIQIFSMNITTININEVVRLMDSNFAWFLLSLVCAISWIVYITFYNSRLTGLVVTKVINWKRIGIIKIGYIRIGSISFSVLSGKIMFRDVAYVNEDFSIRVQDGWIIFRWWRSYVPKDISEDMSHSDTRLSILLNGVELHLYNRSELYARLEKLFNLDPFIIPGGSKNIDRDSDIGGKSKPPSAVGYSWRDLIPVIKLELCSGRIIFGNLLVPYTLAIVVEETHLIYTTKSAASKFDHFMHIVKCKAENFKVMLGPSPKYTGLKDEPPRLMGEGFGILTSNKVELYYYMDEPGVVPNEPEMLQLANGDLVEANPPIWGIDIKCGKGTDFSYGPWADRQRELLYKLFFPTDFQPLKPTKAPKAGEQRQIQSFDIRVSTLTDATIDILFSKDEETNAVHMNTGPGSYLEITIPWVVHSNGYTTKISCQFLHVEASTSIQFRDFVQGESLQFNILANYPLNWNTHQQWDLNITACKASAYLIYAHKWFFQALINDWSSRTPPDLLHFVPYTWSINLYLKEFEIITLTNEYNWIDCSSQNHENGQMGACGELFHLSFDLPFYEFLPETIFFKFWIQVEGGDLNIYIPETNTSYVALASLAKNAKIRNRDGTTTRNCTTNGAIPSVSSRIRDGKFKKWRNICIPSDGWIECWSVPLLATQIGYTYHPMPPLGPTPQADVTTPEKEELLLSPMRMRGDMNPSKQASTLILSEMNPLLLNPDKVDVELEVGPSIILLYGTLLKLIINLKENVFGDYQDFIDMEKFRNLGSTSNYSYRRTASFNNLQPSGVQHYPDLREYRPFEVTVSVILHDIQAHLLKNCNELDSPCPTIWVERFGFEMDKKFRETILQVLLSPIILTISDNVERIESGDKHLKEGYLMLSALQVRGHAMFSKLNSLFLPLIRSIISRVNVGNEGLDLDQETLEYAWLIEIIIGKLSGRLTSPHLENIISGCEAFFLLVLDTENDIRSPHNFLICHHGNNQFECAFANLNMDSSDIHDNDSTVNLFSNQYKASNKLKFPSPEKNRSAQEDQLNVKICPSSEELKYRMIRVSMDAVDVYLSEVGTALNFWISPIRFSMCNLHGSVMKEGFTLLIPNVQLRHFVLVNPSFTKRFQFSDLNIVQSSSETMTASWNSKGDTTTSIPQSPASISAQQSWSYLWLEIGSVSFGPFSVEIGMGTLKKYSTQNTYLMKHDKISKYLWFLWSDEKLSTKKVCGCVGGCTFFGKNSNGNTFFWPCKKDLADGINVAHFRINNPGEAWGFGQSILKSNGLVFDTPPYTAQGVSLLDMPFDHLWNRDAQTRDASKVPFTFRPSLLADLSTTTTSSSQPFTAVRPTLPGKGRRYPQAGQQQVLKRQTRINDQILPGKRGSDVKLSFEDEHYLKLSEDVISEHPRPKAGSYCSDSKATLDALITADEMSEIETEILHDRGSFRRERRSSTSTRPSISSATIEEDDETCKDANKAWHRKDSSSLDSLSDISMNSFISALSVQEECMVNLQMHLNKPISESSLLMPCYMSHLTQLKCDNWLSSGPNIATDSIGLVPFVQMRDGRLLYAGTKYSPFFEPLVDGFTTLAMVNAESLNDSTNKNSVHQSCSINNFWETDGKNESSKAKQAHLQEDDEFYRSILTDSFTSDSNSKFEYTTIIVRAKNDINIMISPMLLEALQRFIEAITPSLSQLHPLTVLNRLHNECISRVEKANLLKKEKSILLNKIQNSKRNTAIKLEETSPVHSNLFEEVSLNSFQGSVSLPKVNVTLLQASVVEEVISFSALDNIRDLMCVSLLAVAIDKIQIHFQFREQVKKSVQVLHRPTILPKAQKKRKAKISTSDSMISEPVFIENSERQSELISTSIDILRIHAQLRRLKNDSSILKEAQITAIPNQHSKVLFRFAKIPYGLQVRENSNSSDTLPRDRHGSTDDSAKNELERDILENTQNKCPDEKLGFIMCECGLEGISMKGVKNSELPTQKFEEKEETVSVTLCNEAPNLIERNSTSNLYSATDTFASLDKENNTLLGNSKEEFVCDPSPPRKDSPSPDQEKQKEDNKEISEKQKDFCGSASVSCVIQFQTMWYNFAAPPQTPITRKIDYTRMDWNLLSTASTAINAWLNPIDQLTIAIITLMKGHSKRATGLLASLMADALEIQTIHQPIRSKYSKLTPLAKTLQEDPSCQLFNVLQRYINQTSIEKIEGNVRDDILPQLSTLRQGVIVLSRQWKNVLYTPLLLEHNFKSKKTKNFTVTFTLPQSEEESPGSDGEETTDERATLLDTEGGTVSLQSMRFNKRSKGSNASTISSESSISSKKVKTLPYQPVLSSTRASDVYPLTEFQQADLINSVNIIKDKGDAFGSMTSVITGNCSLDGGGDATDTEGPSSPGRNRQKRSSVIRQVTQWNANNEASRLNTIMSDQSHEESLLLGAHSKFPQHPSLLLLDAHVIFQPLLSSLGLMPQQIMGNNFENWGSHVSIRACIDTLKIDIVESEGKGIGRGSIRGKTVAFLNIPSESPAFICEKIGLEGDFQKSTDLSRDVMSNRGMIYLSRNYCKKQSKSALIFSLNIDYISQQVNMPLLRLLHQITTMCQNVRETQLELREQRPFQNNVDSKVNNKNGSSSGSDIAEKGASQTLHPAKEKVIPLPNISSQSSVPNIISSTIPSIPKSVMRTQSFAQRLKYTSKAVRGHRLAMNSALRNSSINSPDFPNSSKIDSTTGILPVTAVESPHPSCWRTIYYLLDLYGTRPETKTIINSRSGLIPTDSADPYRTAQTRLSSKSGDVAKEHIDVEKGLSSSGIPIPIFYPTSSLEKHKDALSENPKLAIFGVARIQKTRLLASLSGLKLEAEIMNLQASASYKKKPKPVFIELSLTGHVGSSMIVLLEGIAPNQQTVVKVSIAKSVALYSSLNKRSKERNSGLLTIGPINVDIPQHPVVLHGMMTRSTKQLSNTLQEFRVNRTLSRISRGTTFDEVDFAAHLPHLQPQYNQASQANPLKNRKTSDSAFFQPLVMQFSVIVESLSITASLLPSLQAQYKMERVKSCGVTGSKAKFQIHLPNHNLSFTTKLTISEANLPSAAGISLPQVDVSAEYIQDGKSPLDSQILDGVVLNSTKHKTPTVPIHDNYPEIQIGNEVGEVQFRRGSYLSASADIGPFEHCLTTDLLNHLLFVQKVFMKEVNEVVLKMSGGDKPVPLWDEESSNSFRSLLFRLVVKLQSIQITATTPTNTCAVRLETGLLEFQMSNRVQGMNREFLKNQPPTTYPTMSTSNSSHATTSHPHQRHVIYNKVFVKAQVDVNLSLGQLIRNIVFEEAESEYQQYAFFKTRINLRNALSNEMSAADDADKEVVLITLTRPLIYVQPIAVDKAILVWLNYKNAYEYWNEQRSSLNTEVLAAMPQIVMVDRPHQDSINEQSSILFLQLTVNDMGISIPLNPSPHSWGVRGDAENRGAVVVTLESTSISACSSGSLVSSGRFNGLCFRFSDDMATMDDWKPNLRDPSVMNFCVVSEGTYEVCSKTTSQHPHSENAMWFLNVKWQMEGVDMHVDVNIGKQLSALGHTLTTLAAFEEEEDEDELDHKSSVSSPNIPEYVGDNSTLGGGRAVSQESIVIRRAKTMGGEQLPSYFNDTSLNPKQKRSMLEKEMQERANIIEDLKRKAAPKFKIEEEQKRLQELEIIAFRDFRRDWIKRLRRQSTKASSIKDKLGLGPTTRKPPPLSMRSKSFAATSVDRDAQDVNSTVELAPLPIIESPTNEGPSRSASLRFNAKKQRVTFGETQRQFSVDSSNVYQPDDEEFIGVWLENDIDGSKDGPVILGHMTPGGSSISAHNKAQEPNVDLELDVKVFINSGKCVLHTKPKDEEQEMKKRSERSGSAFDTLQIGGSPISSRKMRHNFSTSRIKSPLTGVVTSSSDTTIFHIPGLDVKIHYNSHILYDDKERENLAASYNLPPYSKPTHERSDSGSSSGTTGGGGGLNTSIVRRGGTKKASLFAWTTLHSVPEETIISPHILDFLEQTLEPIPLPGNQKSLEGLSVATDAASGMASTYYASFPVDVVVFFHMQPSTFRFSCQPISRVECMLRLPSLDIVFSSKRAEEEQNEKPAKNNQTLSTNTTTKQMKFSESGSTNSISKEKEAALHYAIGGLSVTGCLSDFSLYIFHPYGAAKKAAAEWSPLSDNERKDSVSMNVEFIKFHLVRSRKIHMTANPSNINLSDTKNSTDMQQAAIRFSTIVDIGSASFKYDMRRLTEILAFPKAWYRRSIVRRLFLGDLTTTPYGDDSLSSQGTRSRSSSPQIHKEFEEKSHHSNQKEQHHRREGEVVVKRRGSKIDFFSTPKATAKLRGEDAKSKENVSGVSYWDTLVLFAVNFTKLNVQMNMGNVMGNVSWLIRDAKSEGRFSIGSTGHKNLYIGVGLDSSYIDAKGGIVAGTFELTKLNTFVKAIEDPGVEPHHNVGFKMFGLELRLDFMGTSVLMGRVSGLEVLLKDEWQVRGIRRQISDDSLATFRPAVIFIHGDMGWDQLQLMISKSTTVDLLKMHCKLEEFFSQQFKSSKWVFSTLQNQENTSSSTPTLQKKAKKKLIENGLWEDPRHHRHWQHVLDKVSLLSINSLITPLPAYGSVLGGTMNLHGNNISLACFHGVNFKAKSWALFSLKQPFISFSTEAQETHSSKDEKGTVHIVQNLNFSLGQYNQQAVPITSSLHESMAIVCRVTRNVLFPPQFRSLQEWFHYAFAPSEIDDVQRFPSLERERERIERERADSGGERRTPARLHDPNHNREVIFALPNMELFFKTEHLQSCSTPESSPGARPIVECSFITEFGDHIFVTVDAEAFFFLHDLITSYVKEKEKLVSAQLAAAGRSPSSSHRMDIGNQQLNQSNNLNNSKASNSTSNEPSGSQTQPIASASTTSTTSMPSGIESFQRDWRDYHCKTWQLEPTVRLLSWAGKSIEPYGVDYILHKLGFSHARITIPKWMQRGFMDPLDLVLSVLVLRMIDLPKSEVQAASTSHDSNNGEKATP